MASTTLLIETQSRKLAAHQLKDREFAQPQLVEGDGQQVIQQGAFTLGPSGLTVQGRPSLTDWEGCGALLKKIEGAVQWWAGDWLNFGESHYGEKYRHALDATQWEYQTLANHAYVAQHVAFSRRRENVPFSLHAELAALPPAQQEAWLDRIEDKGLSRAALRSAMRLARRQEQYAVGVLPEGRFRVIYADPPWQYDDSGVITTGDGYGRADRHYPTMSVEELCDLRVRDHLTADAVLFLWVTTPMLSTCWPVIEAWGFTYKTLMVWDKVAHNYGHYVSVQQELLIICARGSCTPDAPTPMPGSVVRERRSAVHSEKPESFRQTIDRLYPLGPRLELFGRRDVEGWTVYGNQIERGVPADPGRQESR